MVQQSGTGRQKNSSSLSPANRSRSRAYASSMVLVRSAMRDMPPIVADPAGHHAWRRRPALEAMAVRTREVTGSAAR
jgi:hypothetical protein